MAERSTLVTVSGVIDPDMIGRIASGARPRADYVELAEVLDADLIDYSIARAESGKLGRLIERVAGADVLLAWAVFRRRKQYSILLTDGEQVGLPYAALCWLSRRSTRPRHSMIVHIMSVPKKVLVFRGLRLRRHIDGMIVYSSLQQRVATDRLAMASARVLLTTFMVDTCFFSPDAIAVEARPMICSAGLEFRDYETLVAAVEGLDVEVVIAAASPWSKRASTVDDASLPTNVNVCKLTLAELRTLYAQARFVVMPLREVDFQAGITTILEAMAMGKAVVCSRTTGQSDTIDDGVTGHYVPPGDADALRGAIVSLLDDPAAAERIGAAAREWVVNTAELTVYAQRLADFVRTR